jgi:hypothetical protein
VVDNTGHLHRPDGCGRRCDGRSGRFSLDLDFAVAVVGHVPSAPSRDRAALRSALWIDLLPNSTSRSWPAESYSIGTMLAGRKHRRINANRS